MAMMRLWYDREADFMEIIFEDKPGYFRELDEDLFERVDENGRLIGYAIFNMTRHERQTLKIPVPTVSNAP